MTICIAAIGTRENGDEIIVYATDHMVSNPRVGQFEINIEKYKIINNHTVAMLSGNPLIFNDLLDNCNEDCSFKDIKKIIHKNMGEYKNQILQIGRASCRERVCVGV